MAPVGKLIQAYIDRTGMTRATLATAIGTDRQSLENFMFGDTKHPRFVLDLAERMGLSVADLLMPAKGNGRRLAPVSHHLPPEIRELVVSGDMIPVPRLDVNGSMGPGHLQPDRDTIVGVLPLNRLWAAEHLRGVTSLSNLAMITGMGDSMEPTFKDGDLLLVDRGVTEVKVDTVYVLSMNDELYIKRLQRDPLTGGMRMLSDNKLNEPIAIGSRDLEKFKVLGRVVWAWNGKKL